GCARGFRAPHMIRRTAKKRRGVGKKARRAPAHGHKPPAHGLCARVSGPAHGCKKAEKTARTWPRTWPNPRTWALRAGFGPPHMGSASDDQAPHMEQDLRT